MKKKKIACVLLIIHICLYGFTETFRTHKTVIAHVEEHNSSVKVELGVNDALILHLPEYSSFFEGIELEVKIPPIAAEYPDAVAYSLYNDISPEPAENIIDYSGTRLHIDTFPGRLGCNIKIPLIQNHTMKENPFTVMLPALFSSPVKNLFFRLQLVMKGVPQELIDTVFTVHVKPVLANRGLLDLRITYPAEQHNAHEKKLSVFIDEKPAAFTHTPLSVEAGQHRLSLVSENYRNEVRSFTIEQAKTTLLEVHLQDIVPLLFLSTPQNTRFFLDNTEIADYSKPLAIEPGKHQLRFSLGGYEVLRVLEAENGRTYKVSVIFDVNITEEY